MRVVLIATDLADARRWRTAQPAPLEVAAVVTRRLPDAARGYTADVVVVTDAAEKLPAAVLDKLRAGCLPCLMGRTPRDAAPLPGTTAAAFAELRAQLVNLRAELLAALPLDLVLAISRVQRWWWS